MDESGQNGKSCRARVIGYILTRYLKYLFDQTRSRIKRAGFRAWCAGSWIYTAGAFSASLYHFPSLLFKESNPSVSSLLRIKS